MAAILAFEHFVARNIFELWRLRRLPIARACAISKRALDRSPQNCTAWDYPQHLRRVSFCDPETSKRLVFLTNNFTLSAEMIAALYKKRWAVELFFKWVKQNL